MKAETRIVGDLTWDDEFMHPVGPHPSFNESMMFNFFDEFQQLGGFVRIGNRLNEGHAEMTFCVFLPDLSVLMQWRKPPITSNDRFCIAGLKFEVIAPGQHLRVNFSGVARRLADPLLMRDPGSAMRGSPECSVDLHLDVEGRGPLIGSASGKARDSVIFLAGVGHYQQITSARGILRVADERWPINGWGARDHSWGMRVWSSLYRDRSFWITFGEDLGFILCKTWLDEHGDPDVMGCIVESGRVTPLRSIDFQTNFKRGTHYHEKVKILVNDQRDRRFEIDGRVLSYVPLRHRAPGKETIFLGQAITRFDMAGRWTTGLSEYFDAERACDALAASSQYGNPVLE